MLASSPASQSGWRNCLWPVAGGSSQEPGPAGGWSASRGELGDPTRQLRLPEHDLSADGIANPLAALDRAGFFKDVAVELGRHEVVGAGLLHPIISEAQRRYDISDQRRDKSA